MGYSAQSPRAEGHYNKIPNAHGLTSLDPTYTIG